MKTAKPRLEYSFFCFGHENILATHVKTLEFTKDDFLSDRGDCIVGIRATFELEKLKEFKNKVKFILSLQDPISNNLLKSEHKCIVNKDFNSNHELILRKSFFNSERTFGFRLNRGANRVDRRIVELMKNPECKMNVRVIEGWYE
ncbi:MAG: DUF371 domain-containing protein [Candidatus Dojkabacteria bacterium]